LRVPADGFGARHHDVEKNVVWHALVGPDLVGARVRVVDEGLVHLYRPIREEREEVARSVPGIFLLPAFGVADTPVLTKSSMYNTLRKKSSVEYIKPRYINPFFLLRSGMIGFVAALQVLRIHPSRLHSTTTPIHELIESCSCSSEMFHDVIIHHAYLIGTTNTTVEI
jgi:hypothetical protein